MKNWDSMLTEERIEAVRDGISKGLTGTAIGEKLGCSRQSVVALAWRLRRQALADGDTKRAAAFELRNDGNGIQQRMANAAVKKEPRAPRAPMPVPEVAGPGEGVHLMDLKHQDCRAPLWGNRGPVPQDMMRFCGARSLEGSAYCMAHGKKFIANHEIVHRGAAK